VKVVPFHEDVAALLHLRANRVLRDGPLHPRPHASRHPPSDRFAREGEVDPGVGAREQHFDELILAQQFKIIEFVHYVLLYPGQEQSPRVTRGTTTSDHRWMTFLR